MGYLDAWTIYDHPDDHLDGWIVRAWRIERGREPVAGRAMAADSLDAARALIPRERFGLVRVPASPDDDSRIVETWL